MSWHRYKNLSEREKEKKNDSIIVKVMRIFLRKNKKGKLRIWKIITYCITNISWVGEFSGSLGNFVLWISSRLFYYKNFLIFFFKFLQVAPLPTTFQKKKKRKDILLTHIWYILNVEKNDFILSCAWD